MKRFIARLLVVLMLFTSLSSNGLAEGCNHKWEFEYDPVNNYEVVDETYHKIVSTTLYYYCSKCEEKKVETQLASTQYESKHRFNEQNVCWTCNYKLEGEPIHEHNWKLEYDPESNYEYVDENYHKIVSTTLYYYCTGCDEEKTETQLATTQYKSTHKFNKKNICVSCGYEQEEEPIHEHDWEFEYDPVNNYECVDENYHKIVSTTLYYYCTGCNETRIKIEEASSQYLSSHYFDSNNVCVSCGHVYVPIQTTVPTQVPTAEPTQVPTAEPTQVPTAEPTQVPTVVPTQEPTVVPTQLPTVVPTQEPTVVPTQVPTVEPTQVPTVEPTQVPTVEPTQVPTVVPTVEPTQVPTVEPTQVPTVEPTQVPMVTEEPVHICVADKPVHWIGVYNQYNEAKHSQHHVIEIKCKECGTLLERSNTIEYVEHIFENYVCIKCGFHEILASEEDKQYATKRIEELEALIELTKLAMKNGDVLNDDANKAIEDLANKVYQLKEVKNGIRKLSSIQESTFNVNQEIISEVEQKLIELGYGKVSYTQMIGYYQIVNGLEVTGWITEETYLSIQYNSQLKTEIFKYLPSVGKLNAKELVDLIGSGIQFIQENKDNKVACDKAYAEIEILLKYLKKRPEYLNNKNLKDLDWIYKVGDDTPGFKDIVDVAFTKENIYSNRVTSLPKDYLDQYTEQYIANTLTVIDGAIIITVGGALVYEYATTGTIVLTVGGQTLVEKYDQIVAYAQTKGKFTQDLVNHIFKGNVKPNGKVSGVHFEKYLDNGIKVVRTSAENEFGVYEGMIYKDGVLVKGTASTFFPANWTGTQVIDAVAEAWRNITEIDKLNNIVTGTTSFGMEIEFYLDKFGEIVSAFPKY